MSVKPWQLHAALTLPGEIPHTRGHDLTQSPRPVET